MIREETIAQQPIENYSSGREGEYREGSGRSVGPEEPFTTKDTKDHEGKRCRGANIRAVGKSQSMKIGFPMVVCIVGAFADFVIWLRLRNFKVREKAPASQAGLSIEERQRKVTIATRIIFGLGWFMLAGALFLAWLGNSN